MDCIAFYYAKLRFIIQDTYEGQIDNPLTLNLNTYVHNNPLKYNDPSGNCPACYAAIGKAIGRAILAATGAAALAAGATIAINNDGKVKDFTIPFPTTLSQEENNNNDRNKTTLYHATSISGSNNILNNGINIFYGEDPNKDFGHAFYLTNSIEQAEDWVKKKFKGNGEILLFEVEIDVFESYEGKIFPSANKEWREYVESNRLGLTEGGPYDYIEGPYLKNPQDVISGGRLKGKGNQIAIRNSNLATDVLAGYIGNYSIRK